MYEKNNPNAARRSGDEFLRRMLCGEMPCGCTSAREPISREASASCGCDNRADTTPCLSKDACNVCPYPPLNASMPSLAMAYSPTQAWRCLYAPDKALHAGTLFAELDKPFEGRSIHRRAR